MAISSHCLWAIPRVIGRFRRLNSDVKLPMISNPYLFYFTVYLNEAFVSSFVLYYRLNCMSDGQHDDIRFLSG